MKTYKIIILALAGMVLAGAVLAGCGGKTGFKPNGDVRNANEMRMRYSQEMINSRMSSWYNKDTEVGFPNANSTNGIVQPETEASWDYVPGVVAKGILDVWSLYQDSAWADAWYEGLAQWAESEACVAHAAQMMKGGILDDLNCAKVYIGLYEGAKPGGKFENADRAAFYMEQMRLAAKGLEEHKNRYSIQLRDESLEFRDAAVNGGWMHKATNDPSKSYWGQMWCDGAYMGPALLAQLLVTGACEGTTLGWNDVYDQFESSWPYLWDEEKQLPYHVLFTDVKTNKNGKAIYEAGHLYPCRPTPDNVLRTATGSPIEQSSSPVKGGEDDFLPVYHSEEYWGRAAGWYILALVDVLEAYLNGLVVSGEWLEGDPLPSAQHFDELREMLTKLADGLVARQDPETGCWYQLLAYDSTKCATQGVDATGSEKYTNVEEGGTQCNYLESSASCLITAALLKGSRLGLIDQTEAGKKGFEGILRTFVRQVPSEDKGPRDEVPSTKEILTITSSCQSAGLSKDRWGNAAYYLIGKDVPIQDNGEGKVLGAFLMAAAEYERLCTNSVNL